MRHKLTPSIGRARPGKRREDTRVGGCCPCCPRPLVFLKSKKLTLRRRPPPGGTEAKKSMAGSGKGAVRRPASQGDQRLLPCRRRRAPSLHLHGPRRGMTCPCGARNRRSSRRRRLPPGAGTAAGDSSSSSTRPNLFLFSTLPSVSPASRHPPVDHSCVAEPGNTGSRGPSGDAGTPGTTADGVDRNSHLCREETLGKD